ncbi:MAG: helix-turn-helix transcriptional regulator [Erysipelotrichaceae bacterium]|nr:helix-turn-helix transcriptional regulator [Erysipelotrichaceae bacterium]
MKYSVKLLIKDLIEEKGISQKKLAEMSNVRESTVSDIVRGNRTVINFDHLAKIAEALEIEDISKLIKIVKID